MFNLNKMKLRLRALEPSDLEMMYDIENDESLWVYSNTTSPFSKHTLKNFIENSHLDILDHKQVRLVIYDDSNSYGFIDLFDYNHISRRAGIGIVIFERFRSKGFGSLSLKLIEEHVLNHVPIHQLYANISSDNFESISLFKKNGYCRVGIKKDWVFYKNKFNDVVLFQKILNK